MEECKYFVEYYNLKDEHIIQHFNNKSQAKEYCEDYGLSLSYIKIIGDDHKYTTENEDIKDDNLFELIKKETTLYETGAIRDSNVGKPELSLLPLEALERVAKHYMIGKKKYGRDNWKNGMPQIECYEAALRHLHKATTEFTDCVELKDYPDEDNLSAAIWNIMAIMYYESHKLGEKD